MAHRVQADNEHPVVYGGGYRGAGGDLRLGGDWYRGQDTAHVARQGACNDSALRPVRETGNARGWEPGRETGKGRVAMVRDGCYPRPKPRQRQQAAATGTGSGNRHRQRQRQQAQAPAPAQQPAATGTGSGNRHRQPQQARGRTHTHLGSRGSDFPEVQLPRGPALCTEVQCTGPAARSIHATRSWPTM